MTDMEIMLTHYKPMLLTAASINADPYSYAGMILDLAGNDADLQKYVHASNWYDELKKVMPEADTYKEWINELRNAIVQILTESPAGDSVDQTIHPASNDTAAT